MPVKAFWTDDCQGKQSYDGQIVEVRTRYWPRGGGFMEFNTYTREFRENEDRSEIKPSAYSEIVLLDREEDHDEALASQDFEDETEEGVKASVEKWVQEQYSRIETLLIQGFAEENKP